MIEAAGFETRDLRGDSSASTVCRQIPHPECCAAR